MRKKISKKIMLYKIESLKGIYCQLLKLKDKLHNPKFERKKKSLHWNISFGEQNSDINLGKQREKKKQKAKHNRIKQRTEWP